MTQINLLPWREKARQEKKNQFLSQLVFFIILTIFLVILIHFYLISLISEEKRRIAYLQTKLGERQGQYNILKEKKQQQTNIETELKFILTLRDKSYRAVKLMNVLVKVVPPTITLQKLVREKDKIIVIGKAQSELQVTLFMKNISALPEFNQAVLTKISEHPGASDTTRIFELEITQKGGLQS